MDWTQWINMPSPENCRKIIASDKCGVYEVKNIITNEVFISCTLWYRYKK